jgi:AraC-like DNA-binding protein
MATVTVSAHSANHLARTANRADHGLIDLRTGERAVRAGTHRYEGPDLVTGWHSHDLHEIVYAFQGVAEVETHASRYLLPPQRAMWIPAGLEHCTTLNRVRSVAVFFDPAMIPGACPRARVLGAAPVLREMMIYATRWPISRPLADPTSDAFFEALALVTREAIEDEAPLCLPNTTDPVASAVAAVTQAGLAEATSERVCAAVGISERTLRRRFRSATGMSWHEYLLASRLLRAMALLTERRRSVLEVAIEVGFESASAFARAFARFTGETPTSYRTRVASD